MKLLHLTHDIYTLHGDMRRLRPWVGIIATSEGTVLIDSGNGTVHGAAIQAALEQINAPPVSHILLTHHHWDHVFGNCAFPDAHIVAHEQTQHHLEIMAQEPWSEAYIETKVGNHPRAQMVMQLMKRAISDFRTFRAVPAHETFDSYYHLTLGQYRFTVEHVGGQHEPDQCIVHVQPGNVLFLGDAAYGRGSKKQWDYPRLRSALDDFLARRADWYVEGHRTPARRESFARRIEQVMYDNESRR